MSERVPKHTCSQSGVSGRVMYWQREEKSLHRTDISRSTIDRERWQIKKRKISEKQNTKNKGYDQARGRSRINIGAAFHRWKGLNRTLRLCFFFMNLSMLAFAWICFCVIIFACLRDCRCHGCVCTCGCGDFCKFSLLHSNKSSLFLRRAPFCDHRALMHPYDFWQLTILVLIELIKIMLE